MQRVCKQNVSFVYGILLRHKCGYLYSERDRGCGLIYIDSVNMLNQINIDETFGKIILPTFHLLVFFYIPHYKEELQQIQTECKESEGQTFI